MRRRWWGPWAGKARVREAAREVRRILATPSHGRGLQQEGAGRGGRPAEARERSRASLPPLESRSRLHLGKGSE